MFQTTNKFLLGSLGIDIPSVDTFSKAFKDEGLAMFGIGGCSKRILIFVGEYGLCHVSNKMLSFWLIWGWVDRVDTQKRPSEVMNMHQQPAASLA
jgi:hypothetical protein